MNYKFKGRQESIIKPFTPFVSGEEGEEEVVFYNGLIYDCYEQSFLNEEEEESLNRFKTGANFTSPLNIKESFPFEDGDHFYLMVKTSDIALSKIVKKKEEDPFEPGYDRHFLISYVREKALYQVLSENIFLLDKERNRQWGFQKRKKKENADSITYKINSGFVFFEGKSFFIEGFEYDQVKEEEELTPYLKLTVKVTKSELDTFNDAEVYDITSFDLVEVGSGVSMELPEDNKIAFKERGSNESGTYYIELPQKGNIVIGYNLIKRTGIIEPALRTEVRGHKCIKNGFPSSFVSRYLTNIQVDEDEDGYYQEAQVTKTFDKFVATEDEEGNVTVEKEGTVEERISIEVENPGELCLLGEPVVTTDIEYPSLTEDEFYYSNAPIDEEYTLGNEITNQTYSKARELTADYDWTILSEWTGDSTPVLLGAGRDREKASSVAIHAERRFKAAGLVFTEDSPIDEEKLPNSFDFFGFYLTVDSSGVLIDEEDFTKELKKTEPFVYEDSSFEEFSVKDNEFKKELISSFCQAQEQGGFLDRDIRRFLGIPYLEVDLRILE